MASPNGCEFPELYATNHKKQVLSLLLRIIVMKYICLLLLQLFAFGSYAQDLTGIWVGYIHNDTTGMDLYYEVAITQYKGKLKGYSYTNFIVEGRELTGVKTLDITPQGDKIYIEDDELIFNDYPFAPPKGVKQLSVYTYEAPDVLEGKFMTSRTKQYGKQVTGIIYLKRVADVEATKIYEALRRMNMLANLSFIKKADVAVTPPPVPTPAVADVSSKPSAPVVAAPVEQPKPDIKKEIDKRKTETIETVYFTSDSLVLEVYDNGYVDGDSVSIVINGEEFLSHIRLTATPTRKTIHINATMQDSLKLIMFAENLGTIAPNSGLAVIYDGKKQYKIAFSGDLEKNAAIILRRKKSTQ